VADRPAHFAKGLQTRQKLRFTSSQQQAIDPVGSVSDQPASQSRHGVDNRAPEADLFLLWRGDENHSNPDLFAA